jgi:endonuclease/exonuclease/phosphatase (EEP) superfamily protein YafD
LRRWRLAAVAVLGALVALVPTVSQFTAKTPAPAAGQIIRVMSVNVLWSNRNIDWLMQGLREGDADVIVMQEYTNAIEPLLRERLHDYPHVVTWPRDGSDGWAVYSRVPLARDVEPVKLHWSSRHARFAIDLDGREVAVYAPHLTVPKSMEQVRQNRRETAHLIELLAAETRPVIIAGDFNFTDQSANAAAVRDAGYSAAHDLAGHGRGATWPAELLRRRVPGVRIDHIFLSDELTCTNAKVLHNCGSDHRPIIADVGFVARDGQTAPTSCPAK